MYGHEELKQYTSSEIEEIDDALLEASEDGTIKMTRVYIAPEADKVMDAMEARIKELERQHELEIVDHVHGLECLEAIIKKLEAENERLKAQVPKWISVKDRLPNEKEQNELLWVAYVRTDNTIKYMYEASFDYETKQFYTENDWGDKTFILPSIWMVVPPPPTTEEFSATDKENG